MTTRGTRDRAERIRRVEDAAASAIATLRLLRLTDHGQDVIGRIRTAESGALLPARRYDGDGRGGGGQAWCEAHDRPPAACAAERLPESACRVSIPPRPDRTGDAAVRGQAPTDLREIDRRLRRARADLIWVEAALAAHCPRPGHASFRGDMGALCQSCRRVQSPHFAGAWEVPATTSKPTTLGGLIEKPVLTCSWCERWYRATREPPPRDAVEAHRDGRRVKLPGATPNGTPFADYLAAAKGAA